MYSTCLRCGRPLKNPASAKRGYGNICYKKAKKLEQKIEAEEAATEEQENFLKEVELIVNK